MPNKTNLPSAFGTERTKNFKAEGTLFTFDIDWRAVGCPKDFCLSLGDRLVRIPVPEGFPEQPMNHVEEGLLVYERKQSFCLSSTKGSTIRNVQMQLDASGIDVPGTLFCQDGPFTDFDLPIGGPIRDETGGYIVSNPDGSTKYLVYRRILRGAEKNIADGGPCRPEGLTASVFEFRHEYPKETVRTEFKDQGPTVLVTEHFRWRETKIWGHYVCRAGKWARVSGSSEDIIKTGSFSYQAV